MNDPARGPRAFPPEARLHRSFEYEGVKKGGRRFRSAHFGLNTVANGLAHHRLGMVVQKRFWGAVERNRIKRCLREWFRLGMHRIPLPARDVVVIARPGAEALSPADIERELLPLFQKQGGRGP
ncbi:MAG: ribonuclease P protein component [Acidobacteriota bacterium]